MKIYYSLNKKVIDRISFDFFEGSLIQEVDEEYENSSVFVINVKKQGLCLEFVGFDSGKEAEDFFLKKASNKFSNWSDYSSDDIDAILENGFEETSEGSLCLSWVV